MKRDANDEVVGDGDEQLPLMEIFGDAIIRDGLASLSTTVFVRCCLLLLLPVFLSSDGSS